MAPNLHRRTLLLPLDRDKWNISDVRSGSSECFNLFTRDYDFTCIKRENESLWYSYIINFVDFNFSCFQHCDFLINYCMTEKNFIHMGEYFTLLFQLNVKIITIVYYICQYLTIIKSEEHEIILFSFAYVTDYLLIYMLNIEIINYCVQYQKQWMKKIL